MVKDKRKHISFHIEKTAGNSVKKFLIDLYGIENVFYYNFLANGFIRADKIGLMDAPPDPTIDKFIQYVEAAASYLPFEKLISRELLYKNNKALNLSDLPEYWLAVHGHFYPDIFGNILEKSFKTVVFRDPLDRTFSQFRDWKISRGLSNWKENIDYDPDINFEEFALQKPLLNFQTRALGKLKLKDFDVVGITEYLQGFMFQVAQKRGVNPERFKMPWLNHTWGSERLSDLRPSASFLRKFRSLNEEDYMNYRKATKLAKRGST